jgi:hypothetical protein
MRYVLVAFAVLLVFGCATASVRQAPVPPAEPSPRALERVDLRRAMELANEWGPKVQSSLTTSGATFVFPDGFRRLVAAPRDQVLIAVAPYRTKTHPCAIHTMSSCKGELFGVPVEVLARGPDGKVLIDRTLTTLDNGFLELWLPRELQVSLTLRVGDFSAEGRIDTRRGAITCITTLKLVAAGAAG